MSDIPSSIPDIGSVSLQPRKNPQFDPIKHASLTSEDYFVFSRIDGRATFRTVILETGFPPDRAIEIIRKLRGWGAFLLPGERPYSPRPIDRGTQGGARPATAMGTRPPGPPLQPLPPEPPLELTADEERALEMDCILAVAERREIIALRRRTRSGDYFAVLGVPYDVNKRTLKRAYFALSKRFHPDRYYGKDTGPFGPWLSEIFEVASVAFDVLSDDRKRAAYLAERAGAGRPRQPQRAQTHQEHAAELFDRACSLEIQGDAVEALKLFAAVLRIDPLPRYIKRAARCALGARQLSLAEEYAKKAASLQSADPSCARLLASVYRAAGKLREAEDTLEHALSLNADNDKIVEELQADLKSVRKQLSDTGD